MQKEINCPHCKKTQPIAIGFKHDTDGSLLCIFCDKIIFAIPTIAEEEIKKLFPVTSSGGGVGMGFHSYNHKEVLPIRLANEQEETVEQKVELDTDVKEWNQFNCFA